MVQELIEKAKNKYPVSIYYTGQLSEEEFATLEKVCDVKCPSVYMNGSATYSIRYKGRTSDIGEVSSATIQKYIESQG